MKPKNDDTTNVYISPNAPAFVREALAEAFTYTGAHITKVPAAYMQELVNDVLLRIKKTGTEGSADLSRYFTNDMPEDLRQTCLDAIEAKRTSMKAIKKGLLEDAAKKEPMLFFQFDGYANMGGDEFADDDGDACFSSKVYELRRHPSVVRVHIPIGTEVNDALRFLKKARKWIKRSPGLLNPIQDTERFDTEPSDAEPFDTDIPF